MIGTLPTTAAFSNGTPFEVVWQPLPGRVVGGVYYPSSQALALDSRADQTLYHGTRGPGKTTVQLMRFRRLVGTGYGAFWRGIIFGYEYKNLDDIVTQSKRWFEAFDDGAKFLEAKSDYKWVWPTGEELLFRAASNVADYKLYHGQEFPYIGWNELTNWINLQLYDAMQSTNRSSWTREKDAPDTALPPIPLETFATTNSEGIGFAAVKRRFIDPAPNGTVVKQPVEVFNPRTQQKETYVKTQVAIFGSYKENIYLDPKYVADLHSQTDPAKRESWLTGSWDIVSGGAIDDLWRRSVHVKPRQYAIPESWFVDRAFDWGSTKPSACGWYAVANGETLVSFRKNAQGTFDTWTPNAGSLILIRDMYWYSGEIGDNKGTKESAKKVAQDIIDIERELLADMWITRKPWPGPADNAIRTVDESTEENIEEKMRSVGVTWTESDKSSGSRKNGLQIFRDRLHASIVGEGPGFYVFDNCTTFIALVPVLPRDKKDTDDVDTASEDHHWDQCRYRCLAGAREPLKKIDFHFAN